MKCFSFLNAAIRAVVFCSIIFVTNLSGHGFDLATDVMFFQGGQELIFRLHEDADKLPQPMMSYDFKMRRCVKSTIQSVGVSEANCCVEIGFDDQSKTDIRCTPIQTFYVPAKKQWVPAYKLKVGDKLLSKGKNLKAITCVRFVKKKLRVYALWMKKKHNYMVGKYGVLTHNMVLTTTMSAATLVELAVAFGEGAAEGAAIGSSLGPVTCGIGVVAGLVIVGGILLLGESKKTSYESNFNSGYFGEEFRNYHKHDGNGGGGQGDGPGDGGGGPDGPEDPKEPNDGHNKKNGHDVEDLVNAAQAAKKRHDESKKTYYSAGSKIEGQMKDRGWKKEHIEEALNNPTKTVQWRDTRNNPNTGIKNNDPATVYYHKDGGYIVRNDQTGDIVQISDKHDANWKAPWN